MELSSKSSARFWLEFIEIYRSEPCLWHIKSKEYRDRSKKKAAYAKLVNKLKELEPKANKKMVVKKINNIRRSYRKELKIVNASVNKGGLPYEPKLWYFELLRFLDGANTPPSSHFNEEIISIQVKCSDYQSVENMSVEIFFDDEDSIDSSTSKLDEDLPKSNEGIISLKQHNSSRAPKRSLDTSDQTCVKYELISTKEYLKRPRKEYDPFNYGNYNITRLRALLVEHILAIEREIDRIYSLLDKGYLTFV